MAIHEKVHRSSGNTFEDLGVARPDRAMTRAAVMSRVSEILRERGLTQKEAARVLGVPQSKVSCLMNGKLSVFSLDRLFELLNALDHNVEIAIRPSAKAHGTATTSVSMSHAGLLQEDRDELVALAKRLTPNERLGAHLEHSQLMAEIYRAGAKHRATLSTIRRRRGR